MEEPGIGILLVVAGVVLGAFFAAINAAITSLGEWRLEAIREEGGPHAALAGRVAKDFDGLFARLLAGRVLGLATATIVAWSMVGDRTALSWRLAAAGGVALFYSVVVEVATTLARRRTGLWVLGALKWGSPLVWIMRPFAAPLVWVGRLTEKWLPEVPVADTERMARLTVEKVIEEGQESGSIAEDHAALLRSVLEFKDTVAREVMVPRTRIVAFEIGTDLREVLSLVVGEGHSRYPVYKDKVDHMLGLLYAKDLFRILEEGRRIEDFQLKDLLRKPVFYVAETQKIGAVLRSMQAKRFHIAVVVDEFGGTAGVVTLEDILEEIVGEIEDEYDEDEPPVRKIAPAKYLADAGISIHDLEEFLGQPLERREGDYESVGGFLTDLAGRVLGIGESIESGGFRFVVRDADDRSVSRVEINRLPPPSEPVTANPE
ncbi:MAG: HlyC/CorC family transporter [Myxococcales bacterium]|nr:HlyC/CorC family transporter [Myxococcales bacterium]